MSRLRSKLQRKFADHGYRHGYVESFQDSWIGSQIRAMREQRGWTQEQLAERAGLGGQTSVSRLEDIDYSARTVNSLRRLAAAFDVALVVTFESFGEVLGRIDSFGQEGALEVPSYSDDPEINAVSRVAPIVGDYTIVVRGSVGDASEQRSPDGTDEWSPEDAGAAPDNSVPDAAETPVADAAETPVALAA